MKLVAIGYESYFCVAMACHLILGHPENQVVAPEKQRHGKDLINLRICSFAGISEKSDCHFEMTRFFSQKLRELQGRGEGIRIDFPFWKNEIGCNWL